MNFRLARDMFVLFKTSRLQASDYFEFFSIFELEGIAKHSMTGPAENGEFLTIIPRALMGSESVAHEAEG